MDYGYLFFAVLFPEVEIAVEPGCFFLLSLCRGMQLYLFRVAVDSVKS
jgi:hypothetical protein